MAVAQYSATLLINTEALPATQVVACSVLYIHRITYLAIILQAFST